MRGAETHIVANVNAVPDEQAHYEQLYHLHYARVVHV
jgi:hypothetical protein